MEDEEDWEKKRADGIVFWLIEKSAFFSALFVVIQQDSKAERERKKVSGKEYCQEEKGKAKRKWEKLMYFH